MRVRPSQPFVHVVDDEPVVREAVVFLLEMHRLATRVYAGAAEFLAALDAAPSPPRGCLLLDVRMEPMSGLQLHDELQLRGLTLPVLFLSGHGDIPMAVAAVRKGALDFLVKPFDPAHLVTRVREALQRDLAQWTSRQHAEQLRERFGELTSREHEVMELVAAGRPNKLIADALGIAIRTVEVHRSRVLSKMGIRSAAELAALLTQHRQADAQASRPD